jgi:hypothetical protein
LAAFLLALTHRAAVAVVRREPGLRRAPGDGTAASLAYLGYTVREVAGLTGTPVDAVRTALRDALRPAGRDGHAEWERLAAGYALDALEPADEDAFTSHLRGCARCARDLAALYDAAAALAYAAEPADPPDALRARVVAGLPAPPRPPRARRRPPPLVPVASAAALVLVLGLVAWNVTLRGEAAARADAVARRDAALGCLAAPEAARFALTDAGGRRATGCVAGERAYVVAERLDRNGPAAVYVLWWHDVHGVLHPVERFDVATRGTAVFELPLHVATADVRGLTVSLETGRVLPERPTRPVATGTRQP